MTSDEAIQVLKGYIENPLVNDTRAFELAIKALEQEPCDDCVSRQAVINAIANTCFFLSSNDWDELMACINSLPPVQPQPQPRTGRWIQKEEEGEAEPFIIWECSECHCVDEDGKPSYKYCPQCGAKMEVEE